MKRLIKLMILLVISSSVYMIYYKTVNTTYNITTIGDSLSMGINSYGIKGYSYGEYVKDELYNRKDNIIYNDYYSSKEQTIFNITNTLKQTSSIRNVISESDLLMITLGYNDLVFYMSIEEKMNDSKYNLIINKIKKNYNEMINEIRKYYHEKIVIVSYPIQNSENKYIENGIIDLNNILKSNEGIIYIDTNELLSKREKFFLNPTSKYPNNSGYYVISKEIMRKTLEK